MMDSETGQESDLEVILEDDDLSESDQALSLVDLETNSKHNQPTSNTSTFTGKKTSTEDEQPGNPYLPRLKTSIVQIVLNINTELIRLCKEYQNNSLMDDPQLIMYQMRLQSNLAYLASMADHYLDPTKAMPDLSPLPKPSLVNCGGEGGGIVGKLEHARKVYAAFVNAWSERQVELSKRAKSKMRAEEQELFEGLDRESMHEKFEETMKLNRVIYEGAGDEPVTVDTYKPFPPFRIPDQVKLPPGLQKWKFEDGVAVPDDTDSKHT